MSVYIEGMETPTEGGTICVYKISGKFFAARVGKDELFPIIPIPEPHGRLIDADALLTRINHEVMEAYMDGVCYGVHPSQEHLYLLGEIIDDAPTIIPAEEGGS